ncbi:MAG: cation:proton antiporter [Alphaproteobacteria bacterium]|mgnify:CR=1 FL=1|jgi:CPA2 family monovalent cation:H+ antiporter-2|nr:cation:proton antiporter [Alphaproteobacteria bacterium]MDP6566406.1 cation:proton antiporter [Alphaproteobacteria bacterium]MDP6811636.1 cation:proton antiporter [Alphaproteobacteria bacterium]
MHTDGLLEIALLAASALILGLVLQRLRQPAVVGYIVAGVVLGPSGFDLFPDRAPIETLAELGVLLLLFIIGMELSLRAFRRVLRLAVLGAGAQIVLSVAVMLLIAHLFGRSWETAIVMGFVVAISSTAVAIKLLEDIGELRSEIGRTAVGVLIAQDLAVVPMLLVIQGLAGGGIAFGGYLKILIAVALLAAMIVVLTRRERVNVPFARAVRGNVEVAAITALAYCFGASLLSALLGLSPAYGAFLAGLWIGNSTARAPLLGAAKPIQGVLLMVFFVSIGLLLDVGFIWQHLGEVMVVLLVVTLFKSAMNVGLLRLLGEPWPRAWIAGVSIGQIGEFSFVLVAAGAAAGLILESGSRVVVSVIALSLMLSPLWLLVARRLENLVWHRVGSFRELLDYLFGRETRAMVSATQHTVRFSVHLGERGYQAAQELLAEARQRRAATDDAVDDGVEDAGFESPAETEPMGDGKAAE